MSKILLVGRWQVPSLHKGHRALIDRVIEEGHTPIVAVRDTYPSKDNPFTLSQRMGMIRDVYGDRVEIIFIPDIDQIWVGRDVGYKVVQLPAEIESVSGTDVRRALDDIVDHR